MFGIIPPPILLMLTLVWAKTWPYPPFFQLYIQSFFFIFQKNNLKVSIFKLLYFPLLIMACSLLKASLLKLLMLIFFVAITLSLTFSPNSGFKLNTQKLKCSTSLEYMVPLTLLFLIFLLQAAQFFLQSLLGATSALFSTENYLFIAILTSM